MAQATGLNLTFQYAHGLLADDKGFVPSTTVGLGYQRDFQRRIGMGVDVNYAMHQGDAFQAFEVIYSAKYFTSDNDATAFYLGSFLGFQKLSGDGRTYTGTVNGSSQYEDVRISRTQIPVGLRMGVRGGLQGYFAELFFQAGYNLGNGELYSSKEGAVSSKPLFMGLGFSFLGFGWE